MTIEEQCDKYTITTAEISAELRELRRICVPIVATNLVSYLKGMVSVACMGRLGPRELAGGSLAVGLTNITGLSILSGISLALDPICSQASGSGNPSLAVSALRRTMLLLLIVSLPIAALWFSLRSILILFLRLDPAVAAIAHSYVLSSLPSLLTSSLLLPIRSYLRSLSRPLPFAAASTFSSLALHLPLAPYLSSLRLGISGIALSSSVSDLATLLLLAVYFFRPQNQSFKPSATVDDHAYLPLKPPKPLSPPTPPPPPLPPPSSDTWFPLLHLAIPSCLSVCLEWWWYELIMTIAAGYLPDPQSSLAAAGIVIQTTALLYTLPATLSAAATARVGKELGAGRPARARAAAAIAMALSLLASCFSFAWATLGRDAWTRVFTSDSNVLRMTRVALPVIGLCELGNCPQTVGCGVLRGCARPALGAAINLYSFYLVGAPVAILLAFGLNVGFIGLCFGLLLAQITCAVSIVAATWWIDWDLEAQKAINLVGRNRA
ncbi:hypothetical protein KFK09_006065 [Dendrobium nobile]|uniref:Protein DETOXIFICATION n=1 Tax=Dendrobium nobile TaxID=94219 RepID=A0A8T3BQN4_DENNO|nr:hypothetical protein KFK09_006065 [Dendrobium nobile]